MRQDHDCENFNFDLLTPRVKGGLPPNIWYHVAAFMIIFNLICNITVFEKRLNYDLLTLWLWWVGACGQNICRHDAAFHDSLEFDMGVFLCRA